MPSPTPYGMGPGMEVVHFQKSFSYELHERCRPVHKTHVQQPPHLMRVRVNLLKIICARNCIKCLELYRKVIFANPLPLQGGINLKEKC